MSPTITNIIIVAILVAVFTAIVFYLIKSKRRGDKCIGCPYSKQCGGCCGGETVENKKKGK